MAFFSIILGYFFRKINTLSHGEQFRQRHICASRAVAFMLGYKPGDLECHHWSHKVLRLSLVIVLGALAPKTNLPRWGQKFTKPTDCRCCVLCLGLAALATPTTWRGAGNYAGTLLVVGDCLAAEPSARTPTTAVGQMGTPTKAKLSSSYLKMRTVHSSF